VCVCACIYLVILGSRGGVGVGKGGVVEEPGMCWSGSGGSGNRVRMGEG